MSNLKAVVKSTVMDTDMLDFTLSKASAALSRGNNDKVPYCQFIRTNFVGSCSSLAMRPSQGVSQDLARDPGSRFHKLCHSHKRLLRILLYWPDWLSGIQDVIINCVEALVFACI